MDIVIYRNQARLQPTVLLVATPRFPISATSKVVISDRDRGELNFINGDLTWRYRNRLQVEREIITHSYHPTLYASVEVYYDSKFPKWSSTVIEVVQSFQSQSTLRSTFTTRHQNNTGKAPNQQINAIGLIMNLHF